MNKSDKPKYSVSPEKGLLIYFGFLLGGIVGGSVATSAFSLWVLGGDLEFVQKILANIIEYPEYFHQFMCLNTLSLVCTLLLPSLLFLKLFDSRIEELQLNSLKPIHYVFFIQMAGLLIFTVQPIVGWSGELNKMIVLPDSLHFVEVFAANTDAKYEEMATLIKDMSTQKDLFLLILFICVAPAVIEELVFRGILQNLLNSVTSNKHSAVWIAAILFSLMHLSLYGFLPRVLLGALLGYLYIYSGKFIIPVVAHFINNLLVVLILFYASEQEQQLENPPLQFAVLGTIAFVLVGYYYIRISTYTIKRMDE